MSTFVACDGNTEWQQIHNSRHVPCPWKCSEWKPTLCASYYLVARTMRCQRLHRQPQMSSLSFNLPLGFINATCRQGIGRLVGGNAKVGGNPDLQVQPEIRSSPLQSSA